MEKILFVTGASKGFGFEIAKAALAAGDKVAASVRNNKDLLFERLGSHKNLLVVTMDVVYEEQVASAVAEIIACFGKLDVLVNNAGYGMLSAVEEASDAE